MFMPAPYDDYKVILLMHRSIRGRLKIHPPKNLTNLKRRASRLARIPDFSNYKKKLKPLTKEL
jgi:hypothetical protein